VQAARRPSAQHRCHAFVLSARDPPNPGVRRPAIAVTIPARARPLGSPRRGANADARPMISPVRAHGHRLRGGDSRRRESRDPALSIGEEAEKWNQLTLDAIRAARLVHRPQLRRNAEGRALLGGAGRLRRHGRLHGKRRAEGDRGHVKSLPDGLREAITANAALEARRSPDQAGGAPVRDRLDPDALPGLLVPAGSSGGSRDRARTRPPPIATRSARARGSRTTSVGSWLRSG